MSYMDFSESNCKNCYKCLRYCPVKAIKFKNEKAQMIQYKCILCGRCLEVCPQNVREVTGALDLVKNAISTGKKVVATIAPSFFGYFEENSNKMISALKKIGFFDLQETVVAEEIIAKLYDEHIRNSNKNNFITSYCPSINSLIEKYFPNLIQYLIPIVSPMLAHGLILKKIYGDDTFIVFIGPCFGKKIEANRGNLNSKTVDAVLTYNEIENWIHEEHICLDLLKLTSINNNEFIEGKDYCFGKRIIDDISYSSCRGLDRIYVSGLDECMKLFKGIENGDIKDVIVEASSCKGTCVGGPASIRENNNYFKRIKWTNNYVNKRKIVKRALHKEDYMHLPQELEFGCIFKDESFSEQKPTEKEIQTIMNSMGKYSREDELNCGVCGYDTCRQKAIAIYNGMAETNMCLHYMRSKAESMSNVIFENSATCIILLDDNMRVKQINPAGEEMFMISRETLKDKPISILMQDNDFRYVKNTGNNIIGKKISIPQYNLIFIENIVYIPKQGIIIGSMVNVMQQEKNKRELMKVKENTLDIAQQVIEKQMRVAQEIASLLGETTAETKVILTRLKKVVEGEDGEIR